MTAERMLSQAKHDRERDNSVSAIVFCAFSLEGYLNHVGNELIPKWHEFFESLNPKAKLVLIADRYDFKFTFGSPPFQSFVTIFEIRNQLAHPKTKKHNYEDKKGTVWLKVGKKKWPADKWEALCDVKYAEQFVTDTKQIIKALDDALPLEKVPNFVLSMNV
jgi:hypothetical protein